MAEFRGRNGCSILSPTYSEEDGRLSARRRDNFFQLINSGNVQAVSQLLTAGGAGSFDVNCQNDQGYTGLVVAVQNEDGDMVEQLLKSEDIALGDSLLHAAKSGNCRILDTLLAKKTESGGRVASDDSDALAHSADFSSDLTPLVVAAHNEHFEAIRLLLRRKHHIKKPHHPSCSCSKACNQRKCGESLDDARGRYNIYRALASPSYIVQSSPDPVLTAFSLSEELKMAADAEPEFQLEYNTLAEQCDNLAVALLDQCRTAREVEMLLHKTADDTSEPSGKPLKYARVRMALNLGQKSFVTHANCQQVLRSAWLESHHDWVGLGFVEKCMTSIWPRLIFLPFMALVYLVAPQSKCVRSWSTPFNKFLSFAASYFAFLVVFLLQNIMDGPKSATGSAATAALEWFVALYVSGLAWRALKLMWGSGFTQYARYRWNVYDTLMILVFLLALLTWAWSAVEGGAKSSLPPTFLQQYDATVLSQACYAVALVLAFVKVMYFLQINNALGPLLVSMTFMSKDIVTFLLYFLVIQTSFAVGLHKLYFHYQGQVRRVDGIQVVQSDAFTTMANSIESLYWAMYGYCPPNFADVVISEHLEHVQNATRVVVNRHRFTEVVGHVLLACYYISGIVILVNMLIAMMSNSVSNVQANADTEWKFTRTKVWMTFFENSPGTLPPPFNLIPSPKGIGGIFRVIASALCRRKPQVTCSVHSCWSQEKDVTDKDCASRREYALLMGQLVQRYVATYDRLEMNKPATLGDLEAVKREIQDVRQLTNELSGK